MICFWLDLAISVLFIWNVSCKIFCRSVDVGLCDCLCHAALNGVLPISCWWQNRMAAQMSPCNIIPTYFELSFLLGKPNRDNTACKTVQNTKLYCSNTNPDLWRCLDFTCVELQTTFVSALKPHAWPVSEEAKVVCELKCRLMWVSLPAQIALNGDLCSSMRKQCISCSLMLFTCAEMLEWCWKHCIYGYFHHFFVRNNIQLQFVWYWNFKRARWQQKTLHQAQLKSEADLLQQEWKYTEWKWHQAYKRKMWRISKFQVAPI